MAIQMNLKQLIEKKCYPFKFMSAYGLASDLTKAWSLNLLMACEIFIVERNTCTKWITHSNGHYVEYAIVMWSEKTRHMVQIDSLNYWYHVKVWIILFQELFIWISFDTGIKSYWCSKVEKHKNYDANSLLRHVTGFPWSHHK